MEVPIIIYNPITFQLHLLEQKSIHPSSSIIFLPLNVTTNPNHPIFTEIPSFSPPQKKTKPPAPGLMGFNEAKVSKPESPASAHMYWKHRVPPVDSEAMFCTSWLMLRTPTAAEKIGQNLADIGQKRRKKRQWEVLKREPKVVFW